MSPNHNEEKKKMLTKKQIPPRDHIRSPQKNDFEELNQKSFLGFKEHAGGQLL